ncbi:MAG: sulfatase [Verrucomicrobia bacterium]|nr:sulfatase [Verrucomicrobiota bacterium]MDA1066386.1 sulfatase [Verrucomicrobiota bacterium]
MKKFTAIVRSQLGLLLVSVFLNTGTIMVNGEGLPNIILIFVDDMGYADIGPFGARDYPTPNLDKLAQTGRCFSDFHVSAPVCSASRAALLTGVLNTRLGITGAYSPKAEVGLNPNEMTIAELVKQKGYATAAFGKWHLGHNPKFLPTNQGFDEYEGIPYSNDMWPQHPRYAHLPPNDPERFKVYKPLPFVKDEEVINPDLQPADQALLTRRATESALSFINRNHKQPFFLYMPYSMVHVPIFASDRFLGKSGAGLFGDVVMELDWSIGEIINALENHNIRNNTLVIFTTDNGPWLSYGDHAGSAGIYRGQKHTSFDGGTRVPTIMNWPGKIPANTHCDLLASTIDIFPTIAKLIAGKLPAHKIDGLDIRGLMFEQSNNKSPHNFFPQYGRGELQAVRSEHWKLVFPHLSSSLNGRPGGKGGFPVDYENFITELALYDLDNDPGETTDVKDQHPEIFKQLSAAADKYRDDLGDKLTKTTGKNLRQPGILSADDKRLAW